MRGWWVSWTGDVRARPDIADIGPYLAHGLAVLHTHRDVTAASYQHNPYTHQVSWHIHIGHAWFPDQAMVRASVALRHTLADTGLNGAKRWNGALPPVALRIGGWPDTIQPA